MHIDFENLSDESSDISSTFYLPCIERFEHDVKEQNEGHVGASDAPKLVIIGRGAPRDAIPKTHNTSSINTPTTNILRPEKRSITQSACPYKAENSLDISKTSCESDIASRNRVPVYSKVKTSHLNSVNLVNMFVEIEGSLLPLLSE